MRERGFGAGDAAKLTGVTYQTVDYWSRSGFITASLVEGAGKGSRRRYSFGDLVALRVARRLRRCGVSLQSLRKVQQRLRRYPGLDSPLASTRLVVVPGARPDVARVEVVEDVTRLESVLRDPGQQLSAAVVLDLAAAVGEMRDAVDKLDARRSRAVKVRSGERRRAVS